MKKIAILLSLIVNIGGAQDNYLSFDGVDDYVAINGSSSNIANLTNSSFSFSVWAFPIGVPNEEVQGLNYGQIICRTGMHLGLGYSSGKYFDTLIWDKNGTASGVTAPDTYENSWYHLVFTYNSTTRSTGFYVDGDSIGSVTMEADIKNYSTDYIVGMGNTNLSSPHRYPFSGKIDELAIFSKVLATDEILELYKSGGGLNLTSDSGDYTSSSNLAGYWRFDEGTGTTVADASGNNNNGTIYRGATWKSNTVKNVPARYSTIQAGLNAASSGDTVLVAVGTYTENIIWPDVNGIKLISAGDSSNTIIDGGGISSVIYMNPSSAEIDTATLIKGFKITNGAYLDGGGISCYSSSPTLTNLTITNNLASDDAGGIYFESSNPTLTNVTITNNSAFDNGGGILFNQSNSVLTNVTISGNSAADWGGGIYFYKTNSSTTLTNVTISGNSAQNGGGIACNDASPTLTDVTITNNSVSGSGGGIFCYNWGADPTLENVTISGNSANKGGGVYCNDAGPTLTNVTITNNSASEGGGGIYSYSDSNPTLTNVTISGNSAIGFGGGIYSETSNTNLINCILWDDSPSEIFGEATVIYSDIQGSWEGEGNIDAKPYFCDDASNAYPNLKDDYHLMPLSPALGSGKNGVDMGAFGIGCEIDRLETLSEIVPNNYFLHENYPNPFNPSTTLRFDLPEISDITLTIFNMLGQKVRTFNMQSTPAGYHSITWDATNDLGEQVGAGVYLYQLQSKNFVKTRKMVLLK